jgi:hypothetical protein
VNFREITEILHKAVVDFRMDSSEENAVQKIVEDHVPLNKATAISSKIVDGPLAGMHMPAIDLDVRHYYGPSTTEGHAHLILGTPVTWEGYVKLLTVMEECGIIEKGYLNVALRRGESWMRVPWVKKQSGDKNSSTFNPKTGWFETTIVQGDGSSL